MLTYQLGSSTVNIADPDMPLAQQQIRHHHGLVGNLVRPLLAGALLSITDTASQTMQRETLLVRSTEYTLTDAFPEVSPAVATGKLMTAASLSLR